MNLLYFFYQPNHFRIGVLEIKHIIDIVVLND